MQVTWRGGGKRYKPNPNFAKIFWKVLKLENRINWSSLLTVAIQQIETNKERKLTKPVETPAQEFLQNMKKSKQILFP